VSGRPAPIMDFFASIMELPGLAHAQAARHNSMIDEEGGP
jgi:hypothetical protein